MYDELLSNLSRVVNAKFPSTADGLRSALGACLLLRGPLLEARVEALNELQRKREQYRRPKDIKEYTDWDRAIMLDNDVREATATYELLSGMETLLAERLNVLSSLLLHTPQGSNTKS